MGKAKIVVVNIYFGRLPGYFDLFLLSCQANQDFDFLFFVDFEVDFPLPNNVRLVKSSLDEIRARFQSCFDFPIKLRSPYKLCDYRPAYGAVFEDYFSGYDWWGHCDFDMIFGDLSRVAEVARREDVMKIFRRGHLTLYRNTPSVNSVFRNSIPGVDYREVFQTDRFCLFDETNGIDKIFDSLSIKVFRAEWIADIKPGSGYLKMSQHRSSFGQVFIWRSGRLVCKGLMGGEREFIYIHLQKRRMCEKYRRPVGGALLISQFGVYDFSRSELLFERVASVLPNFIHLWRYFVPRAVRSVRRFF